MNRETLRRTRHKNPKFRECDDEYFDWEERLESKKEQKKQAKKSQIKKNNRDKW